MVCCVCGYLLCLWVFGGYFLFGDGGIDWRWWLVILLDTIVANYAVESKTSLSRKQDPSTGVKPSYRWSKTKWPSKDHGSPKRTFSASCSDSKTKNSKLPPISLTLNPPLIRHRGQMVRATSSMFKACFVRNFAIRTVPFSCSRCDRTTHLPSL